MSEHYVVFSCTSTRSSHGGPSSLANFPVTVRFSGIALSYNVASAIFAGTAPLVATALVKATGWHESPALYVIVASIVVLIVLAWMPEPSRLNLDAAVATRRAAMAPSSHPTPAMTDRA